MLKLCLSGLATGARREVDDLAPQSFRSPLLFRVEVCRDIKPNQFRHNVLLAGDPTPLRDVSAEPMPESGPVKVHISLFPTLAMCLQAECHSQRHEDKGRVARGMREKTQVW